MQGFKQLIDTMVLETERTRTITKELILIQQGLDALLKGLPRVKSNVLFLCNYKRKAT